MARLASPLPIAAVLLLATATSASAQLDPALEIDLAVEGFISYPQVNARWAQFAVGKNRYDPLDKDVTIGNCGCLLATLGSIAQFYYGGTSVPYFAWRELYTDQVVMNFSPRYLDMFLYYGSGEGTQPADGWGYKDLAPGTCGTAPKRWALRSSARGSQVVDPVTGAILFMTPTGLTWSAYNQVGPAAWDKIDSNLVAGRPSIVVIERPNGSGGTVLHAQLVVGWDGPNNNYLIMDPGWPSFLDSLRPGNGDVDSYTEWLTSVVKVFDVQTVTTPVLPSLLVLYDDPGPIELLVVDPDGRRTGFDPVVGRTVRELPSAEAYALGGWASPAGPLSDSTAEPEPARFVEVTSPANGTWRFLVTGTGAGNVPLTLSSVDGGNENVLLDVVRPVTAGSAVKVEVVYRRVGAKTVTEVTDFTPEAKIAGPSRARIGESIGLDAGASFDADGTVAGYLWDFGDGATAAGATAAHAWSAAGVYPLRLTVTDDHGATGTTVRQVTITGPSTSGGWLTERVSAPSTHDQSNGYSTTPGITPDGRYVVFESDSTNLTLDINGVSDVFVKDLVTGAIELVSVSSTGAPALPDAFRAGSRESSISADGRFVAFTSWAENLVPGDVNGWPDVFVHDRETGATELVSVSTTGTSANLRSHAGALSADGRYVVFFSDASNLVPGGTSQENIYLRDRLTGTTELISAAADGTPADSNSRGPMSISADGRFVAFSSRARNLVAVDTGGNWESFVRDRQAGTIEVVSLTSTGGTAAGEWPSMSADGRFVAFHSGYWQVVEGDTNGVPDVFVRDRQAGTTTRVSLSTFGAEGDAMAQYAAISPDGRWVAFHSTASTLVADDTNRTGPLPSGVDVFLHDMQTGTTERASVASDGTEALPDAGLIPGVSVALGGAVVFASSATNLVAGDTNSSHDVFVHRRPVARPVAEPSGPYAGWASAPGLSAHLTVDARRSFDPGGAPLTARWDFGDGTPVVEADAASLVDHAYATAGQFAVTLVVTNGTETSEPVATSATIRAAQPAIAHTVAIPACAAPGARVRLHARGEPLASAAGGWDFGAGLRPPTSAAQPSTLPVALEGGAGTIALTGAVDDVELEDGVDMTTRVVVDLPADLLPGGYRVSVAGAAATAFAVPCPPEPNPRPRAFAGGPYQGVTGAAVSFDGSRSAAAGGGALQYTWDFGDDEIGTGASPSHVYAAAGTYLVTLVVHDGTQSSIPLVRGPSYARVVIGQAGTVEPPAPPAPASGCGCGSGGGLALESFLAGIVLLMGRRKLRRRSSAL